MESTEAGIAQAVLAGTRRQGAARNPGRARPPSAISPSYAAHPIFASLDGEGLSTLRKSALRRSFSDGQTIHLQDDTARFFNYVVAGHVRLSYRMEDGSSILHDLRPAGDTFGDLGIFDHSGYADTAAAAGRVMLASFPVKTMLELSETGASFSKALRRSMAERYKTYLELARDLSLPCLSARLARAIIRIADRLDERTQHGDRTVPKIGGVVARADLAPMARGSHGDVDRILQAWERAGWIAFRDRSILLLERAALVAAASHARG